MALRTQIIRIGNSRGIRIPRPLLEQTGLEGTVQLSVERGRLIIQPSRVPREGWDESFAAWKGEPDDAPLLEGIVNQFDDQEWSW